MFWTRHAPNTKTLQHQNTLLLSFWRGLFFAAITIKIVLEIMLKAAISRRFSVRDAMRIRRKWARGLLAGVGVRVRVSGEAPNFPCLLVCNHRSYLDPIVILREVAGYPVSKADVGHWPVLGHGAKMAGIILVERERGGSRSTTLKVIEKKLTAGFPVILFPEGTTSDLPTSTLPFHKNAFRLAEKLGVPVVPAAIHFENLDDFWVGHETFGQHARRSFRQREIRVQLRYGPPLVNLDAEELVTQSRQWIENQLIELNPQQAKNEIAA